MVGLHPFLFYDVDNDKEGKKKPLSVKGARDLLAQFGIAFAIVPSRNYKRIKESDPRPGIERFRIIVPLEKAPPTELVKDKELFRKFQELFAQYLGVIDHVDDAPLRDMARYYAKHETDPLMSPVVVQGRLVRVDKIYSMACQELAKARQEKEARLAQAREQHTRNITPRAPRPMIVSGGSIVVADMERIKAIPIVKLIRMLEKVVSEYTEGTYNMIKTATAKYSIMDDNVAHDFKSGESYGVCAYLAKQFNTPVLNSIARNLEKLLGDSFLIQDPTFGSVLQNALEGACSRQEVERKVAD